MAIFESAGNSGRAVIAATSGMAGVGETTLAVRAAIQLVNRFPDGCLFMDLLGYSAGSVPVAPADALDSLLRRPGVAADRVPGSVEDRRDLLHDRLVDRRVLLVLDNALDAAQLRPLLPGGPVCGAIVTSGRHLTALDEAEHLELSPLSISESTAPFAAVAGEHRIRSTDRENVVGAIVARCGGPPLAIRIAAAARYGSTRPRRERLSRPH